MKHNTYSTLKPDTIKTKVNIAKNKNPYFGLTRR